MDESYDITGFEFHVFSNFLSWKTSLKTNRVLFCREMKGCPFSNIPFDSIFLIHDEHTLQKKGMHHFKSRKTLNCRKSANGYLSSIIFNHISRLSKKYYSPDIIVIINNEWCNESCKSSSSLITQMFFKGSAYLS